ncbi:MAG: AgmX/PglI C-terminal domain-containing protein [Pseudomonadota bacterium]
MSHQIDSSKDQHGGADSAHRPPPVPTASREVRMDALLADAGVDNEEEKKWLVQKDGLDFGPFSLSIIKKQLQQGEFSIDDVIVNHVTWERTPISEHPALSEFMVHLQRHLAVKTAQKEEADLAQKESRRRVLLGTLIIGVLVLLGAVGVTLYLLNREPEVRTHVVYRTRPQEDLGDLVKGIEVRWKDKSPEQIRKTAKNRRTKKQQEGISENTLVTNLGDASQVGGSEVLSQKVVKNVMQANMRLLTSCVLKEIKNNRFMSRVEIVFAIKGSGQVSSVLVNNKSNGPFHTCILQKMQQIKFPSFDGAFTHADFEMYIQH